MGISSRCFVDTPVCGCFLEWAEVLQMSFSVDFVKVTQ